MKFIKKYLKKKRLLVLILVPIAYLLTVIASNNPDFTEKYAKSFYRVYSIAVSKIFGLVPFSVGEILLVGGAVSLCVFLVITIVKTIKNKNISSLMNFITNTLVISACIYFVFTIACGMNYYRYTFETYCNYEDRQFTAQELADMCESLINTTNEIRETLPNENLGEYNASYSEKLELSEMTYNSFNSITNDVLPSGYSKPKPVFLSPLMAHTQITGVFFPWTVEANVNVDIPYYQIPYTMLHEQAHQRGFMREDEANFIAWLAGKNSEYDIVRYSTYMAASVYAMNSLYSIDYDMFADLYDLYSDKVMADKQASSAYWKQFEDKVVSDTFNKVNDTYLKNNGQSDGVISYGKVTELLLKEFYFLKVFDSKYY